MKQSKFYRKTPFKEQVIDFTKGLLFWKGRKKGIIHTRNIKFDDIRAVFFPKNFHEKYSYLGSVPYKDEKNMLHALVLVMDAEARPEWCPRWFLRFLHLFGSDNSIVRVRNRTLYNLKQKLTKGILMWDYKYKWTDYDLRISISAPEYLQDIAIAIEKDTYRDGYKKELLSEIKKIEPEFNKTYYSNSELQQYLDKLNGKEQNTN
jgi:hypothetical protein